MFSLKCPIPYTYLRGGHECYINQLFGEAKNVTLPGGVSYGPQGHTGVDFDTTDNFKYEREGVHRHDDLGRPTEGHWKKVPRDNQEKNGRVHIYACHEGTLTYILNPDKDRQGWGVFVTSDVLYEGDNKVQYRTLYWHIETPWDGLAMYAGAVKTYIKRTKVKTGMIIAVAGNNGMSSGPHLHLELQKKTNGGEWEKIDPMPYFDTPAIIYHRWFGGENHEWWYQGKQVTRTFINKLTATWPKIIL